MRVLLSGDSHCDVNHLKSIVAKKEKFECDKVFILGDMGWWPLDKGGKKFIQAIEKLDFPIYFLAGNHEDWSSLDQHKAAPDLDDEGFIQLHPNIKWAYDGFSWTWGGKRFLSVGGAYSIDRRHRTKFISWFPQEVISEEDVANSMVGKVDIMLTHDTPSCVDLPFVFLQAGYSEGFWMEEETEKNRAKLQVIVDATEPEYLFHGHYHIAYKQECAGLKVQGLNCNGTPDYFTVIDTEEM